MNTNKKEFTFFVPATFEKGKDKNGKDIVKVSGVCSTIERDLDKQVLQPTGFDFRPLLKNGFINYNHRWKDNPSAIIGEPTSGRVQANGTEFFIEGYLYGDSKKAKEVIELNDTLVNGSESRRLGWSIEGYAVETHPMDKSIITRAVITGVAITPNPKNPKTLVSILKGMDCDEDDQDSEDDDDDDMEIEKMDTGSMPMIESVDGGHKKTRNVDRMREMGLNSGENHTVLKKSQVFDLIFKRFPDIKEEVYEKVYNFITSKNNSNMSSELILKSLSELEGIALEIQEEEDSFEKGMMSKPMLPESDKKDDSDQDDSDQDDDDDLPTEEDEKEAMKEIAKSQYDEGMDSHQMVENLVRIGFALSPSMDAVQTVIKEYQNKPNGGDATPVNAPLVKSFDVDDITFEIKEVIDPKFKAIGSLLKHQIELAQAVNTKELTLLVKSQQAELTVLKDQNDKAYVLLDKIGTTLEEISSASSPAKSLTKGQKPGFIPRFEEEQPAQDRRVNTFSFKGASAEDIDNLSNMTFNKAQELIKGGNPSRGLEDGVAEMEISKMVVTPSAKQAIKQHLGIEIIG